MKENNLDFKLSTAPLSLTLSTETKNWTRIENAIGRIP